MRIDTFGADEILQRACYLVSSASTFQEKREMLALAIRADIAIANRCPEKKKDVCISPMRKIFNARKKSKNMDKVDDLATRYPWHSYRRLSLG